MSPRILVLDIETQRALAEVFDLFPKFIHMDRVVTPPRVLCYAAKWVGDSETLFEAAWDDNDTAAYVEMMRSAWDLLSEADFVVTYNGDRFDLQWLNAEFGRLELGPPAPYRSLDLIKVARKHFGQGLMSRKLQWSARHWLADSKTPHDGMDLWSEIRYGSRQRKTTAQKLMMDYNIHDVELTEKLFERYRPWIGENFALYGDNASESMRCTKCLSENLQKRGHFPAKTYMYQRYRCNDCGSWSRGKKMLYTNELRPV